MNMVVRYSEQGKAEEIWLLTGDAANKSISSSQFTDINAQETEVYPEEARDLLDLAQSKDPVERSQAIANMAVSELNDSVMAKKILTEALGDNNPDIRAKAIASLTSVEDSENARPQLLQMLNDKDTSVRLSTVIAAYNDPVILQQAQNDSNEQVRTLAEISLNKLNKSLTKP